MSTSGYGCRKAYRRNGAQQQETSGESGTPRASSSTTRRTARQRESAHRERGTARPITVVGNPVLHKECQDVTEFDDELAR